MKLGEALTLRANLARQIAEQAATLTKSLVREVNKKTRQPNEAPAIEPSDLLTDLVSKQTALGELIAKINRTNSQIVPGSVTSISDLIAQRDCTRALHQLYKGLYDNAQAQTAQQASYTASYSWGARGADAEPEAIARARAKQEGLEVDEFETITVSAIDIAELRKQADAYAQQYRGIDTQLQQLNWTTDLAG